VNVRLKGDGGFEFSNIRRGDTTDVMLDYVGYDLTALRAAYREKILAAKLSGPHADVVGAALERGLTGYTYLAERDDA
jgi:arginine decarboxylase